MSFGKDSDAILRYLEDKPQDAAARRALHDALMDEGRDEVLTAGVHWLVVNGVWVDEIHSPTLHDRFRIHARENYGIDRAPFNRVVFGSTVAETLRVFSAYLWGLRVWMAEFFGDRPVAAAKKAGPAPVPLVPAAGDDTVPLDGYEEMIERIRRATPRPWRSPPTRPDTWSPTAVPKVTWTSPRPSTSDGGGDLWYYDNTTGERLAWPATRADTNKD